MSDSLKRSFTTLSDRTVKAVYGPADVAAISHERDIGEPGAYPFTRGVHPTMYRGRLWTMRQFAGFATAKETNARYRYLLSQGQTGLSVAFHFPTLMGCDSDHPRARGEVGKCGVAIDSLEDMEILFDGIPLGRVTTSMTINPPAAILLAMYLVVAEKQGVARREVSGTLQNDILKEYIAQNSYIYPPEPSLRLIVDTIEFCTREVPKWNTVSISGYHIREAGSTALQELAFTLADGIAYVEACTKRGLDVEEFAPRLSFFFDGHSDFFEEIAKFRAARRIWARIMKERFGAKSSRAQMLRFHTQTAGCSLTAQQPNNNVVRTTVQALAAVLGGTQSLHTNALDETLALPTEAAAELALRTQQILAYETGVANVVDPLAGSYYVESLTRQMETEALAIIDKIDQMGGMIAAIAEGYPQRELMKASMHYQRQLERGEKVIVGVNAFVKKEAESLPILKIDDAVEKEQVARLQALRAKRAPDAAQRHQEILKEKARTGENLMPYIIDAVRDYTTVGEVCDAFRAVWGEYHDPAYF